MKQEDIKSKFTELFGTEPKLYQSPGRINLIGEHTDYNDGFVLPAAIDKNIIAAVRKNELRKFRFYACDYSEYFELNIDEIKRVDTVWANYLLGVLAQFIKLGNKEIHGFDCVFGGNIPMGAGLSSSAALECVVAFALNDLYAMGLERSQLMLMAQKAEHEYAGVNCGIMDQFASMFGKENQVLQMDCRSLDFHYFPLELKDYTIVLCDTKVKHQLASSEYNLRRQECEKGVEIMQAKVSNIQSLRDADLLLLEEVKDDMSEVVYRRCKYVIEENQRVIKACEALQNENYQAFGEYMFASHQGLSEEYEVSCKELDILVELAKKNKAVLGARMMGGGFGGCTINLVAKEAEEDFISQAEKEYKERTNTDLEVYRVKISQGSSCLE